MTEIRFYVLHFTCCRIYLCDHYESQNDDNQKNSRKIFIRAMLYVITTKFR
jgi:hypothetical protein